MLNNDGQGGRPNGVSINTTDEFKPILEGISELTVRSFTFTRFR